MQKEEKNQDVILSIDKYFTQHENEEDASLITRLKMAYSQSLYSLEKYTEVMDFVAKTLEELTETYDAIMHKTELLILRQKSINKLKLSDNFELDKWKEIIEKDLAYLNELLPDDERLEEIIDESPLKS